MKNRTIALIFCFIAIAFIKTNAATWTVTNTSDAGAGSLRQEEVNMYPLMIMRQKNHVQRTDEQK